jgi:hypothetical protein
MCGEAIVYGGDVNSGAPVSFHSVNILLPKNML